MEARPRQPGLALKVSELLVRYSETKNLNSAALWLRKAEQINQGSLELYNIKKDFMEAKSEEGDKNAIIEIEDLIKNQIKQSPRVSNLYVDLVKYYKEIRIIILTIQ